MKTNGGGWTLVASVHRAKDEHKCSYHDKWSFFPNNSYRNQNGGGSPTWSDRSTMGSVFTATSEDYKGVEYYNQKSSDVMLSHVRNGVDVNDYESGSFLKYYTTDGFLSNYGFSLRNLYRHYVPLKSLNIVGLNSKIVANMKTEINISSIVTGWYHYSYDTGTSGTSINDGGRNMFDVGNQVYFRVNNEPYTLMQYGKSYTDSKTYHISSAANYPFIAMATVSNFDGYPNKFTMKIVSKTSAVVSVSNDYFSASYNGFHIQATALDVFGSVEKPSLTSVLFTIGGYQKWGSSSGSVKFPHKHLQSTNLTYEFSVSGHINNIMMGYMLLSRNDTNYVPRSEVETVLYQIADLLDLPENNILKLNSPQPQVVTKVKIAKGSISYPNYNVSSGYLQLGAYDHYGYPYALCPGVRLNDDADPSLFCIGSADTSSYNSDRCGDFSGWEALRDHVFSNRSLSSTSGDFVNDLHSTILIFTR
uniref:Cortical granule lectin-like n=1 Tax=Phallusia mammillata TaxID=59560 RepID=A0A6F9DFF4_9ASCI|nr:cortical granule lectin-like [Phallusia mammillata]